MLLYLLMILVAILTAIGQILVKKISLIKNPSRKTIIIKLVFPSFIFAMSALLSLYITYTIPFSKFYSFTALNYLFIIYFSYKTFSDKLDIFKISGIALIILGILIYNY